jgi:cytochrome c556
VQRRQIWICAAAFGLALMTSSSSTGQDSSKQVIENRIAAFRDMGSAFKNIADQLKSGATNLEEVKSSARVIQNYSVGLPTWFPPGSEPPPEVERSWSEWFASWFSSDAEYQVPRAEKSRAKLDIWQKPAEFDAAYQHFKREADAMVTASQSGDTGAISSQFQKLEQSCSACHRSFRADDH